MKLNCTLCLIAILLVLAVGAFTARAQDPRLEALGGASLAVETETSKLSPFNLGNPAGAAFLPHQDRMDLSLRVSEHERQTEFTTLYPYWVDQKIQVGSHLEYPNGVTTTVIDYAHHYVTHLDAYGNSLYADAFGNPLDPYTLYARRSGTLRADLNDWGRTGYGGYLAWLTPETVLQVIPKGEGMRVRSAEQAGETSSLMGGGTVRGAWQAAPDLSFGAGATALSGHAQGWGQPDGFADTVVGAIANTTTSRSEVFLKYLQADSDGRTTNPRAYYLQNDQRFGAELGAVWRQLAILAPEDQLDLGLLLNVQRRVCTYDEVLHAGGFGLGSELSTLGRREEDQPLEARVQGVYTFRSVMDIALDAGVQSERLYRSLSADLAHSYGTSLAEARENLDYELSLRVRLPMAHEDDLRFGILFNNRGVGHPYPNGNWRQYLANGLYASDPMLTGSSSIGIATGIVPAEGSLVTLEYFLGSSKSRQSRDLVLSSGYNRFALGAQYQVVDGLTVRAGYRNLRTAYQSNETRIARDANGQLLWDPITNALDPDTKTPVIDPETGFPYPEGYVWETVTLTRSIETSAIQFGVSLGDKPWRVDLALAAETTRYSPEGWTQLDKPLSLETVGLDKDLNYSATLGLSWLF